MHRLYRCRWKRVDPQLSPWPIWTVLHVLAPSRGDVERLAAVVFEQCYSATPTRAGFRLERVAEAGDE